MERHFNRKGIDAILTEFDSSELVAGATHDMKSSDSLQQDAVYTRQDLREKFKINDATINTGVFRPKDHKSIWLFITQKKSSDMTQYNDRLEEDDLHMDGQSAGLTDKVLIEHDKNGDEVLLFFRRTKTEHPEGGFRYEGRFKYVSHTGTRPTHFHFRRETWRANRHL